MEEEKFEEEEEEQISSPDSPLIHCNTSLSLSSPDQSMKIVTIHNEIEEETEVKKEEKHHHQPHYHQLHEIPKPVKTEPIENPSQQIPKPVKVEPVDHIPLPKPVKIEQIESNIINVKIENKDNNKEEEFGSNIEILIPDMEGLFLSRELRQMRTRGSMLVEPRGRRRNVKEGKEKEKKMESVEERRKLYIRQNIEKIKDLIQINKETRKKKKADEPKVKFEE